MLRSLSVPSSESSTAWVTITCPSAVAEKAYSPRRPGTGGVDVARRVVSVLIVRTIASWPGIDRAVNMRVDQRRHAVVQRDRRAGVVGVARREDADPHVQPLVAVDDVVAAIALIRSLPSPPRMMSPALR